MFLWSNVLCGHHFVRTLTQWQRTIGNHDFVRKERESIRESSWSNLALVSSRQLHPLITTEEFATCGKERCRQPLDKPDVWRELWPGKSPMSLRPSIIAFLPQQDQKITLKQLTPIIVWQVKFFLQTSYTPLQRVANDLAVWPNDRCRFICTLVP